MPTVTIPIAQEADDGRVLHINSVGYPPSGGTMYYTATDEPEAGRHNVGGGTPYFSYNALLKFNTGAFLPVDAIVTGATLRVYVLNATSADTLNFTMDYYTWVGDTSDWTSTPGTNAHAGTVIDTGIQNIQRDFDFAISNVSNISVSGYTYLRGHISQRASDAAPTGINSFQFAGYGNTTQTEPRLIVAYKFYDAHVGNDIAVDETTTNPSRVLNAAPATTDYGLALRRETEDIGMQPCSFSNFALAGANPETLASLTAVRNFVTGSAATAHTVTTGKTMRITGFTGQAMRTTGTGGNPWYLRLNLRVNTGGTAVVTSPIAFSGQVGWTTDATTVAGFTTPSFYVDIPGGLDIPSGASFALGYENTGTQLTRVTNEVTVHGYEY